MSLVSDLLSIADRLLSFIGSRQRSDEVAFDELIAPMFLMLDQIANGLQEMYRPTLSELLQIQARYYSEEEQHLQECKLDLENALPGNTDDGPEPNDADYTQEIQITHERWEEKSKFRRAFATRNREQIQLVIDRFVEARAKTRDARIRADSAACALLELYQDRQDRFACRVRQLAWLFRVLLGRAQFSPLEELAGFAAKIKRSNQHFARSDEVLDSLSDLVENWNPNSADKFAFSYPASDFELEIELDKKIDPTIGLKMLTDALSELIATIDTCRDKMHYLYSMIRLAIGTRAVRFKPSDQTEE